MYHRNHITSLQKELDFLKLLVSRFLEQEKVNGLELDVALQKAQDVYEQLLRIKIFPDDENEMKFRPDSAIEEKTVVPERKIENEVPISVQAVKKPETKINTKPETVSQKNGILAEKFSAPDLHPINETLSHQKTGNDLSSKLQTAPLDTIISGIGVNDRFLYIRELFKGDNKLYDNTIKHLDSVNSFTDALNFIHHYFDWDEKNETTQKFIHLIHRRHGSS